MVTDRKGLNRGKEWRLWLALVGLAAFTVALAWPRLHASLRYRPVDLAIDAYYASRDIPTARLPVLIGFAEDAIGVRDHYRYRDGLSQLHYLRGLDVYTPARDRRGAYRASEREAMAAVSRAPAQPQAWLRIAAIRAVLRDEPETVIAPWRMSVFTGRTHSTLLVPRAGVGLAYADEMDRESRAMLRDQLLLAWSHDARALARELKSRDPNLLAVRTVLGGMRPDVVSKMEAILEKIR